MSPTIMVLTDSPCTDYRLAHRKLLQNYKKYPKWWEDWFATGLQVYGICRTVDDTD